MNKLLMFIIVALFCTTSPLNIFAADSWKEYQKLKENYYTLSDKTFDHITCRLLLSDLDSVAIQKSMEPLGKNVTLDENLKDFAVTYSQKRGITFVKPKVQAAVVSTEGISNADILEQAIQKLNIGSDNVIERTVFDVRMTLEYFQLLKRSDITDMSISSIDGKTTVKYSNQGILVTELYSGNTREKTESATGFMTYNYKEEYTNLDDKLAPLNIAMHTSEGQSIINNKKILTYQKIGPTFYPASIESLYEVSESNFNQQSISKVTLCDCEMH
jgi:hypothetical protein